MYFSALYSFPSLHLYVVVEFVQSRDRVPLLIVNITGGLRRVPQHILTDLTSVVSEAPCCQHGLHLAFRTELIIFYILRFLFIYFDI